MYQAFGLRICLAGNLLMELGIVGKKAFLLFWLD